MIRLTWLQFRTQAFTALAAMAAFAILLAATGPHLASLYAASGLSGCHVDSCQSLAAEIRFAPHSYFWICWKRTPTAPASCC